VSHPAIELHLKATSQAAAQALDAIEAAARAWGITSRPLFQIQLAVDEAISNIVKHGYQGQAGEIILRMGRRGKDVWIELQDWAQPFDPTLAPQPLIHRDPETRNGGGVGLHLMHQVMDELSYRREGEANVLHMVKRGAIP